MTLAEFRPAFPADERAQIHSLDRAATGIGNDGVKVTQIYGKFVRGRSILCLCGCVCVRACVFRGGGYGMAGIPLLQYSK
jgi:hypothetical protein